MKLAGKIVLVVGASRGLGRGVASAFAAAGARAIAVSRTAGEPAAGVQVEIANAADPGVPETLLERHDPDVVVLVAGATPHMRPLQAQTWETFSLHWEADVRIAFQWLRQILLRPLKPGARVIVVSSGAAVGGSSLSGGYAGAKAMQRFLATYAQDEARRAGLDLTFTTVLPRFTMPASVGEAAIQGYAARAGQSVEAFLDGYRKSAGPLVTLELAGASVVELATADEPAPAYMLTGAGLQPLP
jgi:NAD(P)-dependent dehydrogenase (short-subunit alcohol dehydrogenase family)